MCAPSCEDLSGSADAKLVLDCGQRPDCWENSGGDLCGEGGVSGCCTRETETEKCFLQLQLLTTDAGDLLTTGCPLGNPFSDGAGAALFSAFVSEGKVGGSFIEFPESYSASDCNEAAETINGACGGFIHACAHTTIPLPDAVVDELPSATIDDTAVEQCKEKIVEVSDCGGDVEECLRRLFNNALQVLHCHEPSRNLKSRMCLLCFVFTGLFFTPFENFDL